MLGKKCHSDCQKNVLVFKRFFLQPLIPQFRISEHNFEKRYNNETTGFNDLDLAGKDIII